jgi:hypothetical protein
MAYTHKKSRNSVLAEYNDRIRDSIEARLRKQNRSWNWLAQQVASNGLCCPATISHWGSRITGQVGSSTYVAILEIIEEDERRSAEPIRIRKGGDR